jgi:hypothetical protein
MKTPLLSEYPLLLGEVARRADWHRRIRSQRRARARARREAFYQFLDHPLTTVIIAGLVILATIILAFLPFLP